MSLKSEILTQFLRVAEEHNKPLASLTDDVPLLDSGLDSLCLAVVVARLEDKLNVDPFNTYESGFPVTVGDFIRFYENAVGVAHQDVWQPPVSDSGTTCR